MLTVQNDWIEYEEMVAAMPARRTAVRGGAACAQRLPVVREIRSQPVLRAAAPAEAPARVRDIRPHPVPAVVARPTRLRLTRRGRIVLVVLPTLFVVSGAFLAAAPSAAEAAPRPGIDRTVVVGTGDSLWTIAERIAPHTDPRVTVAALEQANGLSDGRVDAGATLVLPVR